jgi:hypothetical protein
VVLIGVRDGGFKLLGLGRRIVLHVLVDFGDGIMAWLALPCD